MHIQRILILVMAVVISACGRSQKKTGDVEVNQSAEVATVSVDGLIIVPSMDERHDPIPDPSPKGNSLEPKRYIIWWSGEMCFDGFYNFVVHPTQVFLRTENFASNTSADVIIWEQQILPEQYRAIGKYLEGGTSRVILSETERHHEGYALYRLNDQLRRAQIPAGNYDSASHSKACDDLAIKNLDDIKEELEHGFPIEMISLAGPTTLRKWPLKIRRE